MHRSVTAHAFLFRPLNPNHAYFERLIGPFNETDFSQLLTEAVAFNRCRHRRVHTHIDAGKARCAVSSHFLGTHIHMSSK